MIQFNRQFDPHKIKLLVFDLDGTLIDSRLDLIHSVNAMLRHYERPELPGDVVASYVGDGAPMLVRRALGDPKHEKLVRSEEHTSELQSHSDLVCRLLLEKKKTINTH